MGRDQGIRQLFTAATLKGIMNLPRIAADIVMAIVGKVGSSTVFSVKPNKGDVYVDYVETLTNAPGMARLVVPGNMLFRAPKEGDNIVVLKPSDADGPGVPYAIVGDGGSPNFVPFWFGNNDSGLYCAEALHLESTKKAVQIQANSSGSNANALFSDNGSITVNSGSSQNINLNPGSSAVVVAGGALQVGRLTDPVTGQAGPYPLVNGQIAGGTPHLLA